MNEVLPELPPKIYQCNPACLNYGQCMKGNICQCKQVVGAADAISIKHMLLARCLAFVQHFS